MWLLKTPSEKEVDHAADVLGLPWKERQQTHIFYARERAQNRAANIALLKGLGRLLLGTFRIVGTIALVMGLLYLFLLAWLSA